MKKIHKTTIHFILAVFITVFTFNISFAQDKQKEEQKKAKKTSIENSIKNKNFKFVAQTVNPQRGRTLQLTSAYDLKVSKDTLESYLPYIGRAFVAPVNPSERDLQFSSTNFAYQVTERKKGGWDITIKPTDHNGEQFFLNVFDNGNASLQVTSNNRQPVSFDGYVQEYR